MPINELAASIREGDAASMPILWNKVERLCTHICMRYMPLVLINNAVSVEDLIQSSYIGLHAAVQAYDITKGAFNTYLGYYVKKECHALLGLRGRNREEHYNSVSIDSPIECGEDEGGTLGGIIPDESIPPMDDALILNDLQREMQEALSRLSGRMQTAVKARLYDDMTLKAIGEALGMSKQAAGELITRALKQLRNEPLIKAYECDYYRHKGVRAFNSSRTSVVEDMVFRMVR